MFAACSVSQQTKSIKTTNGHGRTAKTTHWVAKIPTALQKRLRK
ncbi:hypothetical protein KPSA1_01377 [Pseudomonas syringae pv. actinidiae]|uniref:Uncharacterized protein n=1 Tax=Pseudomonas syringae pv. actinidiae TaxID=103796 RepID=A0A2V0Q666_PSESF|nr:hypothetical protein KPSA1_01377 [Pseudomonas syringae pv. actinidiae]